MSEAALAETAAAAREPAPSAGRSAVTGYVEARTQDRILGWAWDPANPEARLLVGLVSGERVIARAVADQAREDLARNGIGDGAHAFAFLLPAEARVPAVTLEVAVLGPDGPVLRLPMAGGEPASPGLAQLQRGLASLAAGQRALLKAIKAPAADATDVPGTDVPAALAAISVQQQRIEQAVSTLEIFVTRLDRRLAALDAPAGAKPASRRLLLLAAALGIAGLGTLAWALVPAIG